MAGLGKTIEMALTAKVLGATEALAAGLVDRVVGAADLVGQAERLIARLVGRRGEGDA